MTSMDREETDLLRSRLTGALIGLARATEGNEHLLSGSTAAVTLEGLFATGPDAGCGSDRLLALLALVDREKRKLNPGCYECLAPCGRNNDYDMGRLSEAAPEIRELKLRILRSLQALAAEDRRAEALRADHSLLYRALYAIGAEDWDEEELLPTVLDAEKAQTG